MEGIFLYNLKSDRCCLNYLFSEKSLIRWFETVFPDNKLEKLCDGSYEINDVVSEIKKIGDWRIEVIFYDDFDIWDKDGKLNI